MDANILYIDDEPINLMLFENIFKRKYQVVTAMSGFAGLEILAARPDINVVICDMKMPLMDGLQFVRKAHFNHPNISFFILTGYEITPDLETALSSGLISNYFQKPFNMEEIEKAIAEKIKTRD